MCPVNRVGAIDLFLSGKSLRDLLAQLAAAGAI